MRRDLAAAGALAALAALTAGCGVARDDAPRTLPSNEVPFDLLANSPAASASPTGGRSTRLYLVRGDRLAATVRRSVQPLTPDLVVRTLVAGPIGDEPQRGLRTAIPDATDVLGVSVENHVALVDVSREFTSVGSEEQILALAQVVFSLTELPSISGVRFLIDGTPVQVPREDGALTSLALVRADYDAVARR